MITTPCPILGSERNSLPPKKRDPRQTPSEHAPHAATFKVPFPYKSHGLKRQNGPKAFTSSLTDHPQPAPTQTLYQPWAQSPAPARAQPLIPIPIRQGPGWAEWSELYHRGCSSLYPGWELPFMSTSQPGVSGYHGVSCPPALPLDHHQHPKLKPPEEMCGLVDGYKWHSPPAFVELLKSRTERELNGGHRGPYRKRRASVVSQSQRIHGGLSAPVQPYQQENSLVPLPGNPQKTTANTKYSVSGHSSSGRSLVRVASSHRLSDRHAPVADKKVTRAFTPLSRCSPSNSPSSSADQHPWLLPHFAAGSLIELGDGRLRRVEDLQTEDFLIGSLACPELRLSCCTVQSIRSSLSLSRLLLLLHEQDTQELVDVYVEYPFFVRGQGWSSCCPQRTSHLCGLRCHQLSVGDVCLALTPVAPTDRAPSQPASRKPITPARAAEGETRPLQQSLQPVLPTLPTVPFRLTGGQTDSNRKRRWSAPEARGVGTNRPF